MPYPNEHACRLRDPDIFQSDSFVRTEREHEGKKYSVISGKLKNEEELTEQAYRYPKDVWAVGEAKSHCESHKGILFEPAKENGEEELEEAALIGVKSVGDLAKKYGYSKTAFQSRYQGRSLAITQEGFLEFFSDDGGVNGKFDYIINGLKPKILGSTAILNIEGFLDQKDSIFLRFFGGVSTESIDREVRKLVADPEIKRVILKIDSPGGSVDGIYNLSDAIYNLRSTKEIVAYVDPAACSAAYLLATATSKVYLSSITAFVGSIGVVTEHQDISKALEDIGVKITEVSAGKFKRAVSHYKPLSPEGQGLLQQQVDNIYKLFIDHVARNLGLPRDYVAENQANGWVFMGQNAIDNLLAYGFSSLDDLMIHPEVNEVADEKGLSMEQNMTAAFLKEKFPAIYNAVLSEGAMSERKRISEIQAIAKPEFAKITEAALQDGSKTARDVAYEVALEEARRGISPSSLVNAAPQPVQHISAPALDGQAEVGAWVKKITEI